jgi:outer membrane biosynthesis protein TonB
MRRSLIASLLFHLAVVAALFVGLPRMGENLPVEAPITVEIVSDASEAKPSPLPPKPAPPAQAAPLPQRQAATPAPPPPAPKVEQKPEAKPAPPPPPPPAQAKPEPPPPKPEPLPEPKKAEAPKPEPAPKKAEAPKPEPVPEPRKVEAKPPPKKPEPVKPEPPKPVEAAKPEPKKEEPKKPVEVAKAEPKKEKPPTPPAAKTEDSDFDALLRSVEQTPKRVQAPEKREAKGTVAEAGGTGQPGQAQQAAINPSLLAASISRQITPCWNIPVAAQGIGGLRAELNIVMAPDGSVQSVVPMDAARMSGDPVFRAFAESAVRAVRACSPLKLPPESYQVWRNIIFNFDPSLMAG